jgi:preprotein translocase subunit SecD
VVSATALLTPTVSLTPTVPSGTQTVYVTVLDGHHLTTVHVITNSSSGEIGIAFDLTDEGAQVLKYFTTAHADNGQQPFYYLSIVLDKQVLSSPHISEPITEGQGEISGGFTLEEAERLAIQLRYGALPVKLTVESVQTVP